MSGFSSLLAGHLQGDIDAGRYAKPPLLVSRGDATPGSTVISTDPKGRQLESLTREYPDGSYSQNLKSEELELPATPAKQPAASTVPDVKSFVQSLKNTKEQDFAQKLDSAVSQKLSGNRNA